MTDSDPGGTPPAPPPPPDDAPAPADAPVERNRLGAFLRSRRGIALLVVLGVVVIVGIVLAVPVTRYAVVGLVVKRDARVAIIDSSTHSPLSGARVDADGVSATTNAKGVAILRALPVGPHRYSVSKQYYRTSSGTVMVPILASSTTPSERLVATGYPLAVTATDRITGAPLGGAQIAFGKSTGTTDAKGTATLVLPIAQTAQTGSVMHDGYNAQSVSVNVAEHPKGLAVALTGTGTLRYLSKATGVIDVMQANLDGTDAKVVLAGTGSESDDTTTLLDTTDWKYSALLANRTGKRDALYVLSEEGGTPVTVDATASYIQLIGWHDHLFFWEDSPVGSGPDTLHAFDADTGRTRTIDTAQTSTSGTNHLGVAVLQDSALVYTRYWSGLYPPAGATTDLVAVDLSTLTPKVVKTWSTDTSIGLTAYLPDRLYVQVVADGPSTYLSYASGALSPATLSDDKYQTGFPTYLYSPSGKSTLWAEPRDGKNTLFVGDSGGQNGKQIATLSDYTPYGWYGTDDRYILLTKNSSELYIAPAGVPLTTSNVLKITDYHKPANTYAGYGSGYGG